MRLAVLGDLHLVSPYDAFRKLLPDRSHFSEAWPSLKGLIPLIRNESPDIVISLGDLVDWYSDDNRDFAMELMAEINIPWRMTPGNHDFQVYRFSEDGRSVVRLPVIEGYDKALLGWERRGIRPNNSIIDANGRGLVLMNSAISRIELGTEEWLLNSTQQFKKNIVFTHVPVDTPEIREFILSVEPGRDMNKYVICGAPALFTKCLHSRVDTIFCGHLHFPGMVRIGGTTINLISLSVNAAGKKYRGMGRVLIIDLDKLQSYKYIP